VSLIKTHSPVTQPRQSISPHRPYYPTLLLSSRHTHTHTHTHSTLPLTADTLIGIWACRQLVHPAPNGYQSTPRAPRLRVSGQQEELCFDSIPLLSADEDLHNRPLRLRTVPHPCRLARLQHHRLAWIRRMLAICVCCSLSSTGAYISTHGHRANGRRARAASHLRAATPFGPYVSASVPPPLHWTSQPRRHAPRCTHHQPITSPGHQEAGLADSHGGREPSQEAVQVDA
jgi:hypothetical protein